MSDYSPSPSRIWEIDFLRGIAVILMILFHLVFDLHYFFDVQNISYTAGFWYYIGRLAAILFIVVSGISSVLLYRKYPDSIWQKTWQRSVRVLGLAALITLATWLAITSGTIWFGILHFFTVSMLLSPLFLRLSPWTNVVTGIILISFASPLSHITTDMWFLLPLGIIPNNFFSLDYYPLLPWLGITLWGIALGQWFYLAQKSLFPKVKNIFTAIIEWCGKRSLLLYVIHQPILLLLLSLGFQKNPF